VEMTGGEALAAQLAREGVRHVFGIPGVQLDYAMDGLVRQADRIQYIVTRHEQAAAYMADGYARSSGGVGVCMVVPGPGVLNAGAGLATAYSCSSRVLLIAGQIPSAHIGEGLGLLHEIPDQSAVLASLTKWSAMAQCPEAVPGLVREAFRQLSAGRPRPVALQIAPDVLRARADVELLAPGPDREEGRVRPDPGALGRAADRLRGAKRPVIYAGGGVLAAGATDALARLAERLAAPVVVSTFGRGAMSDRHPLALTALGGHRVLPEADVVLVVGSRFVNGGGNTIASPESLVLVNADERDLGGVRRPDVAVHADALLALEGLLALLQDMPERPSRAAEVAEARAWAAARLEAIPPQAAWLRALREAIPDDGILVDELTQVGYVARVAYPVYGPRTYLTPGYQGTLGYGFPTALGAKVANPDRPVVSITGDGGFGWCLQELATAHQFGIGLVTVVFNDGAFGNVRRIQMAQFDGRVIGSELVNPDYRKLAEAFGVRAARADSPEGLVPVLREALAAGEPALIEAPVEAMPSPWPVMEPWMASRYAERQGMPAVRS
jgi:acetolactate synthase I/II/III large subunit